MSIVVDFLSDALGAFRAMPAEQATRWLGKVALNTPTLPTTAHFTEYLR